MSANFLYPTGFTLKLAKIPGVEFSIQSANIPGVSLGNIERPTPHIRLQEWGNITYEQLTVSFLVDSDLGNYLEIFNWMRELGHPNSYQETRPQEHDGSLLILNKNKKPCGSIEVKFQDIFPVYLSPLNMDVSITQPEPVVATGAFVFDSMLFERR